MQNLKGLSLSNNSYNALIHYLKHLIRFVFDIYFSLFRLISLKIKVMFFSRETKNARPRGTPKFNDRHKSQKKMLLE